MLKVWGRADGSNVIKAMWCIGELGIEHERIDWGGQFENLERARVRLGIAVPTALLLVLTLLYLSLKRVRDVAIIATGIPFAFVLGWLFFDEAPFAKLIPGVFLIVAGGMLIAWREHRNRIDRKVTIPD